MVGGRRANEFWYQYDMKFYLNPSDEISTVLGQIVGLVGGFDKTWDVWLSHYRDGDYPNNFIKFLTPVKDAFAFLSREQRLVYDEYFGGVHRPKLVTALQEFGQGTLYDPRCAEGNKVHMMNFTPPEPTHSYHRWHMFLRAFELLNIDAGWWMKVHRLAGMAWELQSMAQPRIDANDNPHLPERTVCEVTAKWVAHSPEQLDRAFAVFPYPADMAG
ncbi:Tat pathway signal sequence domain protein [Streptomyces sp. NPDC058301]|uniref:Tat pathway signal sequence domain protein n=1 Tax=Streptomyces sp. NPDC058301 TaxID=3346436 RepID=UPI0036E4ABF4